MKRIGVLLIVVFSVGVVGTAAARHGHKPGYTAKHHRRHDSALSGWSLAYSGTASWSVTYEGSNDSGESYSYMESSETQWHYGASTEGGAGFSVTYPTPCRMYHSLPCPSTVGVGSGKGPAVMSVDIHDHTTSGSPPVTDTLNCTHDATDRAGGGAQISAKYIRGTDSYALSVTNDPIPAQVIADNEAACPDANGVTKLDDWPPTDLPSGSNYDGAHFWSVKPVVIPASVFAANGEIDIPVSLIARFAPPGDCGLPAAPAGDSRTCKVRAGWRGVLRLSRTS